MVCCVVRNKEVQVERSNDGGTTYDVITGVQSFTLAPLTNEVETCSSVSDTEEQFVAIKKVPGEFTLTFDYCLTDAVHNEIIADSTSFVASGSYKWRITWLGQGTGSQTNGADMTFDTVDYDISWAEGAFSAKQQITLSAQQTGAAVYTP